MSAEPIPLRLVNSDGVIVGDAGECPECEALRHKLEGAERDVNTWRVRYGKMARDKEAEYREHPLRAKAEALFAIWQRECRHPRSGWDADRFFDCLPYLKKDGDEMCLRAIAGAAFDPWAVTQKNGHTRRFDEWERIFGDRGKFESFVNRAPKGWKPDPADMEAMNAPPSE